MKFSDIDADKWKELGPYLDTCLLPLTGLTGKEEPWQATEALERLRDVMESLEKRFVGRMVTYPAVHFVPGQGWAEPVSAICRNLKESAGFKHVVLITADPSVGLAGCPDGADLLLNGLHVHAGQASGLVEELWQGEALEQPDV